MKIPALKEPNIYRFYDYREFLKSWFNYKKTNEKGFSLRSFSKQVGLATGYLPMVLSGARHLSHKSLLKLMPFMHLSKQEQHFFETIVILGSSDSQEVRLQAFEQIKHFVQYKKQNPKELEVQQYLTHWFYVAIREMAALPLFQAEPEWIQNHLNVHVPLLEIKKALDFLIKNNFIKQNEDGTTYVLTKKNLDCLGGVYRLALTQFHKEMFQLASESIENTPSEKRHLMGHSFAITEENFFKVREILNNALEQIKNLETSNEILADIYHIELALFPLTKGEKHETH